MSAIVRAMVASTSPEASFLSSHSLQLSGLSHTTKMEADPLYRIKQLFYQASYQACIEEAEDFAHGPSEDVSSLHRALYIARSHLALGAGNTSSAHAVLLPFLSLDPAPLSARAVDAFASFLESGAEDKDREARVEEVRDLVLEVEGGEDDVEERQVRVVAAGVFTLMGENEEAVATLTEGAAKHDLECIAVLVQLLLSINRKDLAVAQYNAAKKVGDDSMLIQAMEAWIGLKTGSQPLEHAYFYYDELYNLPSSRTGPLLAAHSATFYLRGNAKDAKADIVQAAQDGNSTADVLAVGTSLNIPGYAANLASQAPRHPFAIELAAKDRLFDDAAAKYVKA